MPTTIKGASGFLDPARLYTLKRFQLEAGISTTRIFRAKRSGIELPALSVGKRIFVRGKDAIEFLERLAASPAA